MNSLKSLLILSLVLTVVARRSKRRCKWGIPVGCTDQDDAVSRVHKEEWQGIPETFQDPVEEGIPDEGKNAWNARDLELKNRKRASRYESFKAYLKNLEQ